MNVTHRFDFFNPEFLGNFFKDEKCVQEIIDYVCDEDTLGFFGFI